MAKSTPGLRAALKVVNQLGNKFNAERGADYSVALSALSAGQSNLSKQTRAATRDLLLGQTQNRLATQALRQKALASTAKVGEQQARTTNQYGSALGQSTAVAYKQAQGTAKASAAKLLGASRVAGQQMRTAEVVAGIAKSGVAAQRAAAEYSLNQALQQRTIIDNQTLAALTGQLYQSAIDYNNQWSLWKKQQKYAERQAAQSGPEAKAGAQALMTEGGDIASGAADSWREYRDEWYEPDGTLKEGAPDFNITEVATEWATTNGYSLESPQAQLYITTLRQIKNGATAPDAFAAAMNTLYSQTKGWDKWGQAVIDAGMSGIETSTQAALLNYRGAALSFGDQTDIAAKQGAVRTYIVAQQAYGDAVAEQSMRGMGYTTTEIEAIKRAADIALKGGDPFAPTSSNVPSHSVGQAFLNQGGLGG